MVRHMIHYWRSTISVIAILLLIGISFIYALQTSDQMKVQADAHLTDQWRTGYDLLVYPDEEDAWEEGELTQEGLTSDQIVKGLLRRGDMANHGKGISLSEYEKIQTIDGVEVAAPLSFIGNVENAGLTMNYGLEEHGFYYADESEELFDGIRYRDLRIEELKDFGYFQFLSPEDFPDDELHAEIRDKGGIFVTSVGRSVMLRTGGSTWSMVGIDPEQEANLLNIDQALKEGDFFEGHELELVQEYDTPIVPLILLHQPYDIRSQTIIYKLDVPTDMSSSDVLEEGGLSYLKEQEREKIIDVSINPFSEEYLFSIGSIRLEGDEIVHNASGLTTFDEQYMTDYTPLQFTGVNKQLLEGTSVVEGLPQSYHGEQINYRRGYQSFIHKKLSYQIVGTFDVTKLENEYVTSPEMSSPDFYSPEDVLITHDVEGNEYDEPYVYASTPYKAGYYTGGIDAITTLAAAEYMLGDRPISLIRVIVDGVGERSPDSMAEVERVAEKIQEETGLNVDLMLGSADRKVHVLLDDYEDIPGYGYLLEGWSEEGASFVIEDRVSATTLSLTLFIVAMGLICLSLIYRNYTESRKRDMSVQYTFGWSKWKIAQSLAIESIIMILFIVGCLFIFKYTIGDTWAMGQFWLALIISISLTMLVMTFLFIIPILRYVERNKTLRGASINHTFMSKRPGKTLWSHSVRNILRHPVRSMAKLFIIMSTILYIFIFFVSKQKSSSFLGLTFLGENIDAGLEKHQWVLFIVGIALAISSYVAIHIHQTEARLREIQLFEAWGWKSSRWRTLYLLEETFLNTVAVCVGIGLSVGILTSTSSVMDISGIDIGIYVGLGFILTIGLSAGALIFRSKNNRLREFQ